MNTGLQDACNLAWKLALVIQKKAKEALLDTYMAERQPIAKRVIHSTDKVFKMVTSHHFFIKTFRIQAVPIIMKLILPALKDQKAIRRFFFSKISEIGIHYRKSSLSQYASLGKFPPQAPKPGDRLPFIQYFEGGKSFNIQDKLNNQGYHLLVFAKDTLPYELILGAEKCTSWLFVETIPYTEHTVDLYKRLGIKNCGCYLVRPDMYIAYRSVKPVAEHFEGYLRRYLIEY